MFFGDFGQNGGNPESPNRHPGLADPARGVALPWLNDDDREELA